MNEVLGAIIENLKQIEITFDTTLEPFKKDTKQTGDSREITVKQFLESFFPLTYKVKKGPIYSLDSNSQEIDCVILAPNHPPLITPKREVILSEGVYAAVEVKPDIRTLTTNSELYRALVQVQSVKKLKRTLPILFTEGDVPEEFHRIPCIIFSKYSRNALDTIDFMKQCVTNQFLNSKELPDVIITLDNGIIFHSLHIEKTIFQNWIKQQSSLYVGEKYIHLKTNGPTTLSMFLLTLLCFKGPEPLINDHIIKNYLVQNDCIVFNVIEP